MHWLRSRCSRCWCRRSLRPAATTVLQLRPALPRRPRLSPAMVMLRRMRPWPLLPGGRNGENPVLLTLRAAVRKDLTGPAAPSLAPPAYRPPKWPRDPSSRPLALVSTKSMQVHLADSPAPLIRTPKACRVYKWTRTGRVDIKEATICKQPFVYRQRYSPATRSR